MPEMLTTLRRHNLRVQVNRPQKEIGLIPAIYDAQLRIAAAARAHALANHRVDQRLSVVEGLLGDT